MGSLTVVVTVTAGELGTLSGDVTGPLPNTLYVANSFNLYNTICTVEQAEELNNCMIKQ